MSPNAASCTFDSCPPQGFHAVQPSGRKLDSMTMICTFPSSLALPRPFCPEALNAAGIWDYRLSGSGLTTQCSLMHEPAMHHRGEVVAAAPGFATDCSYMSTHAIHPSIGVGFFSSLLNHRHTMFTKNHATCKTNPTPLVGTFEILQGFPSMAEHWHLCILSIDRIVPISYSLEKQKRGGRSNRQHPILVRRHACCLSQDPHRLDESVFVGPHQVRVGLAPLDYLASSR